MITDSLPEADFDAMLGVAARLEMDMLEFGCGNWSTAPHIELDRMLESATRAPRVPRPRSTRTASGSARSIAPAIPCIPAKPAAGTTR